jgi:hypothetical protein
VSLPETGHGSGDPSSTDGQRKRLAAGEGARFRLLEMFDNSVRHSRPGAPGETVTVVVRAGTA